MTRSDPHILAVDMGSSSVRAALYDRGGRLVEGSLARRTYQLRHLPGGGAELDPGELLQGAVAVIDQTFAVCGRLGVGPAAVVTDTLWHSVLGVDAQATPTTPVLTWADRRAAGAAAELQRLFDGRAVHRRTGCVLHASYLPAKLLWASRSWPQAFAATRRWLSPGEHLHRTLFGEAPASLSMASGTGLYDQHARAWDAELLAALPLTVDQLAVVSEEPMRGLRQPWARRWPALASVPWFPAWGDGACSNIGAGCTRSHELALMVGTTGALRLLWEADEVDTPANLWCYRVDARRLLMGGALSDGGNLVAWLQRTLRLPGDTAALEAELAAANPDSHGLTVLPLLAGERGPGWDADASGVVAGLSHATTPVQILHAAMEAVALRFALIAQILDAAVPARREVVATGGALRASPAWVQMIADALGLRVTAAAVPEASSRGAALLGLERLGVIDSLDAVPHPRGRVFLPVAEHTDRYRAALARQRELYERLGAEVGS